MSCSQHQRLQLNSEYIKNQLINPTQTYNKPQNMPNTQHWRTKHDNYLHLQNSHIQHIAMNTHSIWIFHQRFLRYLFESPQSAYRRTAHLTLSGTISQDGTLLGVARFQMWSRNLNVESQKFWGHACHRQKSTCMQMLTVKGSKGMRYPWPERLSTIFTYGSII